VEDRILFHKWSKEIDIRRVATPFLTTSEIKFDLQPKSTNILFILCFYKKINIKYSMK